jgi:hypothetical protein
MDPDNYISADNPLMMLIAAIAGMCFAVRLAQTFIADCRRASSLRTLALWGWSAGYFPVVLYSAKHVGWWTLGISLVWGIVGLKLYEATIVRNDQNPSR